MVERATRRSRCRASAAATPRVLVAAHPRRDHRAARRGDLRAGGARGRSAPAYEDRLAVRRRADRRRDGARRRAGARRAGLPPAGAPRRAARGSAASSTSWRARCTRPASVSLLYGAAAVGGSTAVHDGRLWSRMRHRVNELVREIFLSDDDSPRSMTTSACADAYRRLEKRVCGVGERRDQHFRGGGAMIELDESLET